MAPRLLEMLLKCESEEIKEYIRGRKKKEKKHVYLQTKTVHITAWKREGGEEAACYSIYD